MKNPGFLINTVATLTKSQSSVEPNFHLSVSSSDFMNYFTNKILTIEEKNYHILPVINKDRAFRYQAPTHSNFRFGRQTPSLGLKRSRLIKLTFRAGLVMLLQTKTAGVSSLNALSSLPHHSHLYWKWDRGRKRVRQSEGDSQMEIEELAPSPPCLKELVSPDKIIWLFSATPGGDVPLTCRGLVSGWLYVCFN